MLVGALGQGAFGWFTTGGSGGSGPGAGNLTVLAKVCGSGDGPVNGQTTYQNDLLIGATNVVIGVINNANEVAIGASPQFTFDTVTGIVDRAPNGWNTGDTLILWYTPAP